MPAVIPTLNALYNIRATFYETDNRVTNRFSLIQVDAVTFTGETNFIGYRVSFNNPADVNFACLSAMNKFAFV